MRRDRGQACAPRSDTSLDSDIGVESAPMPEESPLRYQSTLEVGDLFSEPVLQGRSEAGALHCETGESSLCRDRRPPFRYRRWNFTPTPGKNLRSKTVDGPLLRNQRSLLRDRRGVFVARSETSTPMPESLGPEPVPISESLDTDIGADSAPMPETSAPMPERGWFRYRGGIFPDAGVESVPRPETSTPMSESFDSDTGAESVPFRSETGDLECDSDNGEPRFRYRTISESESEPDTGDLESDTGPMFCFRCRRTHYEI